MTNLAVHFKGKLDALVSMKIQIKGHSNLNVYFTFFRIQQNKNQVDRPARRRPTGQPEQHCQAGQKQKTLHTHACQCTYTNLCSLVRSNAEPVSKNRLNSISCCVLARVHWHALTFEALCTCAVFLVRALSHSRLFFVGDRARLIAALRSMSFHCHPT